MIRKSFWLKINHVTEHLFLGAQVYTGSSTQHVLRNLCPGALYNVRVCGVRHSDTDLTGPYSSVTVFNTSKQQHNAHQQQQEQSEDGLNSQVSDGVP